MSPATLEKLAAALADLQKAIVTLRALASSTQKGPS